MFNQIKNEIAEKLRNEIQEQILQAKESYSSTKTLATSEDMRSEGKYDTRAIEAGQLASAQKARVETLEKELALLDSIDLETMPCICVGSLVQMKYNNLTQWYFVSSTSGGRIINIQDLKILIVSAFSPIGNAMISLENGDIFELDTPKEVREYEVLQIK